MQDNQKVPHPLPRLVDWPKFLMLIEQGDDAWIAVGPGDASQIDNYSGWKYLQTISAQPGTILINSDSGGDGYYTNSNIPPPPFPSGCSGRWWKVKSPADLGQIIPKVQRLIASDNRVFIAIKDGNPVVGDLPAPAAAGRAFLATLGGRQLALFPADKPGAYEFQQALWGATRVGSMLVRIEPFDTNRLPPILQPDPNSPHVVLRAPMAHVTAQGWLCTIQLASPPQDDALAITTLEIIALDNPPARIRDARVQFPATEWPRWDAWLRDHHVSWTVDGDPNAPWNQTVDEARLATIPGWTVPVSNGRSLHPFQKDGVRFAVTRGARALLGDDMGLGKTAQAIGVAIYQQARRVVVVAPASVRGVWRDELLSWGAADESQIQLLRDGLDQPQSGTSWLICSYDQITTRNLPWKSQSNDEHHEVTAVVKTFRTKLQDRHENDDGAAMVKKKNVVTIPDEVLTDDLVAAVRAVLPDRRQTVWDRYIERRRGAILRVLAGWEPDLVIFDEAHRLKNSDAKRTSAAIHLSGSSGGCLLLTGTPIQNRTNEPAVLLHVLDPAAYQEVRSGERISIERIKGLLKPSMIRRLKADVLTELPDVVEQVIPLDGDGLETIGRGPADIIDEKTGLTILESLERTGLAVLTAIENRGTEPVARTEYNILRAAWSVGPKHKDADRTPLPPLSLFEMGRTRLGLAKAQSSATTDLIVDILESRGCLVVFTAHHDASDYLAHHLAKTPWKAVVMDGRTPADKRSHVVRDFQEGKIDCLIAGMDAAGEGITLHRADTCLFLEMAQKPSTVRQARDRLHRIGQKATVQAFYLVADNPLDRFFRDLCFAKADLIGMVLDEEVQVLAEKRGVSVSDNDSDAPERSVTNTVAEGANGDSTEQQETIPLSVSNNLLPAVEGPHPIAFKKPKQQKKAPTLPASATEHQQTPVTNDIPLLALPKTCSASGSSGRRAAAWESAHKETVQKQTAARVRRHREKDPAAYREYMRKFMQKKRAARRLADSI